MSLPGWSHSRNQHHRVCAASVASALGWESTQSRLGGLWTITAGPHDHWRAGWCSYLCHRSCATVKRIWCSGTQSAQPTRV